jgi:hypothetical protein
MIARAAGAHALLVVVVALAAGSQALGAKPLTIRSTGNIENIGPRGVTVAHLTCAIRGAKAGAMAARFVIDDPVTIVCRNGVLARITYRPPPPSLERSSSSYATPPTPSNSSPARIDAIVGAISALSTTAVVFGNPVTLGAFFSCALGERSPDLHRYAVGDRVRATCRDGTLTSITPAP